MKTTAITNGLIYTSSSNCEIPFVIERGTILIVNQKIASVGTNAEIPPDAEIIDATGNIITPGLIDAHCHIGIAEDGVTSAGQDSNESSNPITAEARALDAVNPTDIAFEDAIAAGITCVQTGPGSANIIGGDTLVIKTWGSSVLDELLVLAPSGVKAALGENPKRVYGSRNKMPKTRMGNAAALRKSLFDAKDYVRQTKPSVDKSNKTPQFDLGKECLARVIKRELPMRIHCHRTDDIVTAIRIAKEFNIDISLEHCTEGDKIVHYIKDSGFPVTMGPSFMGKSKLEIKNIGFAAPVALSRAGVKVAIITDHPVFPIQFLRVCAGLAVREGMDERLALLGITLYPAQIAGVSHKVGSIEPGKDADIVIWTKDPFEYDSKVLATFINGNRVYQDNS